MGKCAELCGEFHAEMIFNVKVVSPTEYDDYIQSLRDQGNEGELPGHDEHHDDDADDGQERADQLGESLLVTLDNPSHQ